MLEDSRISATETQCKRKETNLGTLNIIATSHGLVQLNELVVDRLLDLVGGRLLGETHAACDT